MHATPRPIALIAYLCVVAALTSAYWTVWFLVPGGHALLAAEPGNACHRIFENAFPAADLWMAFCAAMAAARLLQRRPQATGWLFMAGSAGVYLFGMDVLYDLQNGIYLKLADPAARGAVGTEMTINAGTLLFAVWSLRHAWRNSLRH